MSCLKVALFKLLFESCRNEENTFVNPPPGDFPIPLPPPGGFDDMACLDTGAPAPEQGPLPDPDLGTLFSSESEAHEDVRGKKVLLFRRMRWQQACHLLK
jgi:hypothetical protein